MFNPRSCALHVGTDDESWISNHLIRLDVCIYCWDTPATKSPNLAAEIIIVSFIPRLCNFWRLVSFLSASDIVISSSSWGFRSSSSRTTLCNNVHNTDTVNVRMDRRIPWISSRMELTFCLLIAVAITSASATSTTWFLATFWSIANQSKIWTTNKIDENEQNWWKWAENELSDFLDKKTAEKKELTWLIVLSNVAGVIFDGDRNFERPFAENEPGTYSGEYSYRIEKQVEWKLLKSFFSIFLESDLKLVKTILRFITTWIPLHSQFSRAEEKQQRSSVMGRQKVRLTSVQWIANINIRLVGQKKSEKRHVWHHAIIV